MNDHFKFSEVSEKPSQVSGSPPSVTRAQRLPFHEKSWEDLERLCVRLAKKDPDTEHSQSYGLRGQNQDGIDLYVLKRSTRRYEVWQSVLSWFEGNSQELRVDYFCKCDEIRHDAANPISVKFLTLLLKGLASACGKLTQTDIEGLQFRDLLAPVVLNEKVDHISDMWTDRNLGGNLIESYLSDLPDEKLSSLVGEDVFLKRLLLPARFFTEAALVTLIQNPNDIASRNVLLTAIGDRPIYADIQNLIPELLGKVDFVKCFETDPQQCPLFILLWGQLANNSPDPSAPDKLWAEGLRLAAFFAKHTPQKEGEREHRVRMASVFTELAVRLSAKEELEAGLELFCQRLRELAVHWPEYARLGGLAANETLNRVPADKLRNQPELQALLRSLA